MLLLFASLNCQNIATEMFAKGAACSKMLPNIAGKLFFRIFKIVPRRGNLWATLHMSDCGVKIV